jgi:hypothetical protein
MSYHGKSKKHTKNKKDSHSDSDSSDSESSSKQTVMRLQGNAALRKYPFAKPPANPNHADYLNLVRTFLSPSHWTQEDHAQSTSVHSLQIVLLMHASLPALVLPEAEMAALRSAAAAFPQYKSNLELLERELPRRRERYAAEALESADEANGSLPGGNDAGGAAAASHGSSDSEEYEFTIDTELQYFIDSDELYEHIETPQLYVLVSRCLADIEPSKQDEFYSLSLKDMCEQLCGYDTAKASQQVSKRLKTLKREFLKRMQVNKAQPQRKAVSKLRDSDSDVYPLEEVGDNNNIPKIRLSYPEANRIGFDKLHKLRGFSHEVYRLVRKLVRHHQKYLEVLIRCAEAFSCEQMKAVLQEWGSMSPEDMLAGCSELEKLFHLINSPRLFMGLVDKHFNGFKVPEAVCEDQTIALTELSPLNAKNDNEHAHIFKAQANKCAEVGCEFSEIVLVIKFLNTYKRALADPNLDTPRAQSARNVYNQLRRHFDDMAHQKRTAEIELSYYLDMATRISTELMEGAAQTGNNQHQQRGGGNPTKRSRNAPPPQQPRSPFNQFAGTAAPEQSQRPTGGKGKGKGNQQNSGGRGRGRGKGKGKGWYSTPYCNTCGQNHYGKECPPPRAQQQQQQQQTRGGPPPQSAPSAAANLTAPEVLGALKVLSGHFGLGQGVRLD